MWAALPFSDQQSTIFRLLRLKASSRIWLDVVFDFEGGSVHWVAILSGDHGADSPYI
jgi:hypothetical protein